MDTALLWLLGFGLACLWLLAPIVIIQYCHLIVPKRLVDIRNIFLLRLPPGKTALPDERGKTAAWHYARLQGFVPLEEGEKPGEHPGKKRPEQVIDDQFWYFHAAKRYLLPVILITLITGAALAFTGLWVAVHLEEYIAEKGLKESGATNDTRKATAAITPVAGATATNISAGKGTNLPPATNSTPKSGTTTNPPSSGPNPKVDAQDAANKELPKTPMVRRVTDTIIVALWGGLVWGLYEILTRRKSGDLTPTELWDVVFRLLAAIPTGYAFAKAVPETFAPTMAFAVSAFPYRELRHILRRQALRKLGEDVPGSSVRSAEGHIGSTLCGLGDDTVVRLGELNVVTFLDLAYADPVRLMVRTGAPPRLVMAWIDQALLAVYAEKLKEKFAAIGMPCALDACEFYIRHCYDLTKNKLRTGWKTDPAIEALRKQIDVDPEILVRQPMRSIYEDQQTQFLIRVWYGPQWDNTRM